MYIIQNGITCTIREIMIDQFLLESFIVMQEKEITNLKIVMQST